MTSGGDLLASRVADRRWYHTIDLGGGVVTPGWFDTRELVARVPLPTSTTGLRCLDIGTFDGFWAFEMERRGSTDVVAIDVPDPADWDWPVGSPELARLSIADRHRGGGGFEIAAEAIGSRVDRRRLSVYDLSPEVVGDFDLVYLGSLLLHLRDPVRALERVRSVTRGTLVVVDAVDAWMSTRHPRRPIAILDGTDRPWWWKPNRAGLVRMVTAGGFDLDGEPVALRIPPGLGHERPRLRMQALRNPSGREALLRTRLGDPHLAIRARPRCHEEDG